MTENSQPSASVPQQRKISSRASQFEQSSSSSSSSPTTSAPTRTAPKAGNSLKDRIAMFSQASDAPIPVPPSHGLGLGIPPPIGGAVVGKGLYGNRIPSGSGGGGGGGGVLPIGTKKTVESKGLIGNRIPSFQRGGIVVGSGGIMGGESISRSGSSSPQEGNVPAPRSASSTTSDPNKIIQSDNISPIQPQGEDLVPSTLPKPKDNEDPGTPRSTITEPTEDTISLPSGSQIDVNSEYPSISRTTSSLSITGGAGGLTSGSTAVPSSMDVQSDTSSSRQLMHDVSGVSTPTGTPKMMRKGLEEDPIGAGPTEDEEGDLTAMGIVEQDEEDVGTARLEKLNFMDSAETTLNQQNVDIQNPIVSKSTTTPKPSTNVQDLPTFETEESGLPDITPMADKSQFITAEAFKQSLTTKAPVEIEEAEETAAVMAQGEENEKADAEVPVEVETEQDPIIINSASKKEVEKMETETPTSIVEPSVGEIPEGVRVNQSEQEDSITEVNTNVDSSVIEEAFPTNVTSKDFAGKQMEVEPMPFVAPPESKTDEGPAVADEPSSDNGDKTPGPIKLDSTAFPSVPDGIPSDDDGDALGRPKPSEAGSSSATTPIDPTFLKSFPSVPTDEDSTGHAGQLGSPEGKVHVQVHVPSSPNRGGSMPTKFKGALSPPTSPEAPADGGSSPEDVVAKRPPSVRTAIEDAEDDGEAGWAKVQVKSEKYT